MVGPLRNERTDDEELTAVARDREVQRMLFDAGLAGICFPQEYGGQGLTPDAPARPQRGAGRLRVPVPPPGPHLLAVCGRPLGLRHRGAEAAGTSRPSCKGEEIWMQFLSEPSGGSDVAGALTSAVRDGEEWVLNGSKIWTTGAWWSDWGLCLARTNWDVPEAPGPDRVHPAHPPAGPRRPPHRDAQRLQGVLPGVPDRCPGPRLRPGRRRSTTAGRWAPGGCSTSAC